MRLENVSYKEWLGIPAAFIFWIASIFCFVLGLAFKSSTGFVIPGVGDVALLFSFGLGIANTIVQIIGNDYSKEELGMVLFLGWIGSYMLGIGSNVNYLYSIIDISNIFLKFMVCFGLGTMIEVVPERLVVRFLRKARLMSSKPTPQPTPSTANAGSSNNRPPARQPQAKMPVYDVSSPRQAEPTYHKVTNMPTEQPVDLPEFVERLHKNMEQNPRGR